MWFKFLLTVGTLALAIPWSSAYGEISQSSPPKAWRCPPGQTCTANEILCPDPVPPSQVTFNVKEINSHLRTSPNDPHTWRCTAQCECRPPAGPAISCQSLGMMGPATCLGAINDSNSTIELTPSYEFLVNTTFQGQSNAERECREWVRTIPVSICEQACQDNLVFARTCYTGVPNPNWLNEGGCDIPQSSAATPYCETNVAP